MDISGSSRIAASRASVWEALHDPAVLKDCIPGCERFERTGEGAYEGAVAAKVGPLKAVLAGTVTVSGAVEPERFSLAVKAQDEKAGGGEGRADVTLTEEDGATIVTYVGAAEPDGKIGQLGSRLVTGVARVGIEAFFAKLSERLGGPAAVAAPAPEPAVAVEPEPEAIADAPPLAPESAEPSAPVELAEPETPPVAPPPLAEIETPNAIAPTAAPDIIEPEAVAAREVVEPSKGSVTRIMLVAAVAVVVAIAVYVFMLQPPAPPPA